MGNTFYFEWEPVFMNWIQSHLGSFGVSIASLCSAFGEEIAMIVLMCFLYLCYDKEIGKYVGRRFMVAGMMYSGLKNIFCRLRPYMVHRDQVQILKPVEPDADIYDIAAQGYSFPSGHSTNAASAYIATATAFKKKVITIIAIILMVLVGVSRFCVGAHYPTDVLGGWALGVGLIFLFTYMEKVIPERWIIYLIWTAIGIAGCFFCTTNDYYSSFGMMVGFFIADYFEQKFVNFEMPTHWFRGVLRIIGGGLVYVLLNKLLKLPFSAEFLSSATTGAYLVRAARYMIILFVDMGIYPMLFKYTAKIGKK